MNASTGITHQSLQLIDLADASDSLAGTSSSRLGVATRGFEGASVHSSVHAGEPALIHVTESGGVHIERSCSRQSVRLDADSIAEVGHEISLAP